MNLLSAMKFLTKKKSEMTLVYIPIISTHLLVHRIVDIIIRGWIVCLKGALNATKNGH